nr:immunoglobulin light chain junction region [Mus musculus]
CQQSDSWPHTF